MQTDLRGLILHVLAHQPNLTSRQLAVALNQKEDTVYRSLKRLEKAQEVRAIPKPTLTGRIYFWRLINDKRAILRGNLNHEITANNLYASLVKSGLEFEWEPIPELGKFLPDRAFTAFGKQFYIENHTGTQTVDTVIPEKIENYIRYSASDSQRFHTLFITHDYTRFLPKKTTVRADDTANQILDVIESYHRANQFSVCLYKHFIEQPLERIFVASYEKGLVSLEDL